MAGVRERQVPVVAERHAVGGKSGELPLLPIPRHMRHVVLDAQERVGVANVPAVPVDDEEIFVAVQIHVEERRPPRPITRRDSRKVGNLSPCVVTAREEEGVLHPLLPVAR